jgi:hypothetical protein
MNDETKMELELMAKQLAPKIQIRFTTKEEKRDLRQFLLLIGASSVEKFTLMIITQLIEKQPDGGLPNNLTLETIAYSFLGKMNSKKNVQFTPGIEAVIKKFLKVFMKVFSSVAELKKEDIGVLNEKAKEVLSSIAYNEDQHPKEILNIIDLDNLTTQIQNSMLDDTQDLELLKFNVRYMVDGYRPDNIFKITYKEVIALAAAFNSNTETIRISGDLINITKINKIKIFSITKEEEFRSEQYNSSIMHPTAKRLHNIGNWSYEKFLQFGDDVTNRFLKPIGKTDPLPNTSIIQNTDIDKILKEGENRNVEFKSRFRWDKGNKDVNKQIESINMRAIASFLNTSGGILLIGVDDKGLIIGLEDCINSFSGFNKLDAFKRHFDNLLSRYFDNSINRNICFDFKEINEKIIAVVRVTRFSKPVYLKNNDNEEFFIRRTASSIQLTGKEQVDYIKQNWP